MTPTKTALAAAAAAIAIGAVALPQIASAAACSVTKAHAVKKVVHKTIVRRPTAVAAYRETARPVTRTVVETRYIHEPPRVIVAPAPVYYHSYYEPYPVFYHRYHYARPYYHHVYYEGPDYRYHHRHW